MLQKRRGVISLFGKFHPSRPTHGQHTTRPKDDRHAFLFVTNPPGERIGLPTPGKVGHDRLTRFSDCLHLGAIAALDA